MGDDGNGSAFQEALDFGPGDHDASGKIRTDEERDGDGDVRDCAKFRVRIDFQRNSIACMCVFCGEMTIRPFEGLW